MSTETGITFSNPRKSAVIENWPHGFRQKAVAVFEVERHPKKGERVRRTTTGKPVYTTYSDQWVIVDGSDGLTYALKDVRNYEFVDIFQGNLKYISGSVHKSRSPEKYQALLDLIGSAAAETAV